VGWFCVRVWFVWLVEFGSVCVERVTQWLWIDTPNSMAMFELGCENSSIGVGEPFQVQIDLERAVLPC